MNRSARVLVVGGGPAGASTAFALARAGVDVLVLDRARFPRDKPCAEYLSPQASRILSEMGALEAVERAGAAQLSGMKVRAPSGTVIHGEFAARHGFHGFRDRGLALPRTVLDAILLDRARAAGAQVAEGVRVRDLSRDATGRVNGVIVDGERHGTSRIGAGLVIGADGLRSVVARRLGLAARRRWPRRVAVVTHWRGVEGVGACGEMHVERDGYVGIADVGNGLTNVAVVVPASEAHRMEGDPAAFLERWIAARAHLAPRFARAERVGEARATGPFAVHARRAWAPGAALVGDAADFFDPFTGEGIHSALAGGEALAAYAFESLRAQRAHRADIPLAAYDRWRRHTFGGKWTVERLIGVAVAWPVLLERAARTLSRRRDMADLLVGVTGDFVPPREVLRPGFFLRLLLGGPPGATAPAPRTSAPRPS